MLIRRLLGVGILGSCALPAVAGGQATGDQARLVFTVSIGAVGGKALWSVGRQAVQFAPTPDTFNLDRRIRSTLAAGFGGAYFPGDNLGFTAEAFLLGLGFEDNCRHVFSSGSTEMAAVCQSIQGEKKAATSVVLSGGTIYRLRGRKVVSPYARLNLGVAFSTQSPIRMLGEYPTSSPFPATQVVYADDKSSRVDPSLALGLGFTAAVAKGYNLRWEIRDNIVGVQSVTSSIPVSGAVPPHERAFKHLFSMTLGFDVVLERRKGRRY